jgi:hypothetical protein
MSKNDSNAELQAELACWNCRGDRYGCDCPMERPATIEQRAAVRRELLEASFEVDEFDPDKMSFEDWLLS